MVATVAGLVGGTVVQVGVAAVVFVDIGQAVIVVGCNSVGSKEFVDVALYNPVLVLEAALFVVIVDMIASAVVSVIVEVYFVVSVQSLRSSFLAFAPEPQTVH